MSDFLVGLEGELTAFKVFIFGSFAEFYRVTYSLRAAGGGTVDGDKTKLGVKIMCVCDKFRCKIRCTNSSIKSSGLLVVEW